VGLWVSGIEEWCTYVRGGAGGRTQVNATKRQWNQRNQPSTVAAIMGNTHPWLIQSARKGQRHLAAVPRSVHFCSASVQISTSPATNQKCELKTQIQFEPKAWGGENIANKEMSRRPAHHF